MFKSFKQFLLESEDDTTLGKARLSASELLAKINEFIGIHKIPKSRWFFDAFRWNHTYFDVYIDNGVVYKVEANNAHDFIVYDPKIFLKNNFKPETWDKKGILTCLLKEIPTMLNKHDTQYLQYEMLQIIKALKETGYDYPEYKAIEKSFSAYKD